MRKTSLETLKYYSLMVLILTCLGRNVDYQMIFPNCPSYLSSTQPKPVRLSRDEKDAELFPKAIKQNREQQVIDEATYKYIPTT